MVKDAAYRKAEQIIEEAWRSGATKLDLSQSFGAEDSEKLTELPDSLWELTQLQELNLSDNQLTALPKEIGSLAKLEILELERNPIEIFPREIGELINLKRLVVAYDLSLGFIPQEIFQLTNLEFFVFHDAQLTAIPPEINQLHKLEELYLGRNEIAVLPQEITELGNLRRLYLFGNQLTDLPPSLAQLEHLEELYLEDNPLNPELAAAYKEGLPAIMAYLRAKAEGGEIVLNEAKLILVGEGGVGKTSLLAALRGEPFVEDRPTTHGVEVDIKSLVVQAPDNGTEITLNGWDFGGQNIYRHTHQLFFTAPAVYLAIWEPRRGPEQCRVAEWIKMIKHRAYDEARPGERPRILVVATHGGPTERLDHIDEQALRDEFGDLIAGFYHVDSRPGDDSVCYHLDELKTAIGREAAAIPSVGRTVPLSWKNVLEALRKRSEKDPYIRYEQFENLCNRQKVSNELAATYATILNELGHLIYYRGDETLKDTVILRPDYLSKAVSFVLEDKATKDAYGLVEHDRLCLLWNNPDRLSYERYPPELHPIFLRLMSKFDLLYQVVMPEAGALPTSLMAQLVPGQRPEGWQDDWTLKPGDVERTQVCRVLDATTGRTVEAEGLMYRLIVRLHRYSLGRENYHLSRHWKTGMILDDGYNGRAFIDEVGGDIYVTVRAAYPERFLSHLCHETQWLVEYFWKGLDARLFVPCPTEGCKGLLELGEILAFKSEGMSKVRCAVCKQFYAIDGLMATMQPKPEWNDAVAQLRSEHRHIMRAQEMGFDRLGTQLRVLMSQADEQYANLLRWLSDPAKEGPRLFSFVPVNRRKFDPRYWVKERFDLILWCEHSKLPVPLLNGPDSHKGIIEIELTREWFKTAAPFLKILTGTLSLILPVASSGLKLALDETVYKWMEDQLDFCQEIVDASLSGTEKVVNWLDKKEDETEFERGELIRAQGSVLRELHAILKEEDPGFGGLVRVQNKRREFLWVHECFKDEYL